MTKRISLYGIMAALCMVLGFVESLLPLSFIATGVKLGLANSVALLLLAAGDTKGAFAVNITRILLSAFLFSTLFTLLFSLTAGIFSIVIMRILSGVKSVSVIGFSVAGAAVHNIIQLCVACAFFGSAVWYYLPVMLLSAVLSGAAIGLLSYMILKKIKTKSYFQCIIK